jgi:hypothetical protein
LGSQQRRSGERSSAPPGVDLWEVFSASRPNAEVPLELWRQLLASGGTAAPVAAGDVHSVAAARRPRIATYVYARERSTGGVLGALRARRVFTSDGARLRDDASGGQRA